MNRLVLAALLLVAAPAFAQDATSNSSAGSMAQSGANNLGNSLGVTQVYNSNAEGAQHYSGEAKILSTPGIVLGGAAAGFSNNNCANSGQISAGTMWFAIGGGKPVESEPCNDRQTAGTFYDIALREDAVGRHETAAASRAMGLLLACRAAAAIHPEDLANCRELGLLAGGPELDKGTVSAPSSTVVINAQPSVDKRKAARTEEPSNPRQPD